MPYIAEFLIKPENGKTKQKGFEAVYSGEQVVQRRAFIDDKGIPSEGGYATKKGRVYTDAEINAIVDCFFEGKTPPAPGQGGYAEILLGAPGSGKSLDGLMRYEALSDEEKASTIYVSYDETGAIFAIPEYQEDLRQNIPDYQDEHVPVDPSTKDIRQEIWDDYRDPSQLIRNRILKRAAAEGYNLMIDTTSSSRGSVKLIETLRTLDYDQIACVGTFAPFVIGALRCIAARVRPTSNLEVVSKRVGDPAGPSGALNMIAEMMQASDYFEYQYNPDNEATPRFAFSALGGEIQNVDPEVVQEMVVAAEADLIEIFEFMKAHPQNFKNFNPAWVEQSYDGFFDLMEGLVPPRPAPFSHPQPAF